MTAGEMMAHAAGNARIVDTHQDIPERLAPNVGRLFELLRPSPKDRRANSASRAKRKARFENAVLKPGVIQGKGEMVVEFIVELIALAAEGGEPSIRRRAKKMLGDAAPAWSDLSGRILRPVRIHGKGATDLGRALAAAAFALDVELGPTLHRPTGRQKAAQLIMGNLPRILSMGEAAYLEGMKG
jgi:hypothetical protein